MVEKKNPKWEQMLDGRRDCQKLFRHFDLPHIRTHVHEHTYTHIHLLTVHRLYSCVSTCLCQIVSFLHSAFLVHFLLLSLCLFNISQNVSFLALFFYFPKSLSIISLNPSIHQFLALSPSCTKHAHATMET